MKEVNCGCEKIPNQVCDICQGLSKPWRQVVFPDGPWSYVWHGPGEDRGYTLKHGRDKIAYVGDQISSSDMQDIAWAHNVQMNEVCDALDRLLKEHNMSYPIRRDAIANAMEALKKSRGKA